MGSLVTYRLEGPSARIAMDDGKVNVFTLQMLTELHAAFERAEGDGVPVVLSGRDGIFSAGFDLQVLRGGGLEAADLLDAGFTLIERVLSFPTPVAIACTGHAIAMGLFLVLSGDYRIGVAGPYKFTANEVAIGFEIPRTPVEVCRHRLLPGYFDRTVILAEVFSPDSALAGGILDRVVEASELDGAVDELATALAALDMRAHGAAKLRARQGALEAVHAAVRADDAEFRARVEATSST
jgi:enoyl-CoA hydratase